MRCNFRIYLSSWLAALLLSCFANMAYSYGMECDKPTIGTAIGATMPFSFNCTNSTGVTFASYQIFPVCQEASTPNGVCNTVAFTATGCPYAIPSGADCVVQGSFMPTTAGNYILDFNDRYASVTYSNIFCNDPSQGCIDLDAIFAYVTPAPGSHLINNCALNSNTGEFVSCSTAYTNSPQIYEKLTFAIVAGVQYAYVTDPSNNLVYQCTLDANGRFDSCTGTIVPPSGWQPYDIAFATVGGVQYAYVTDIGLGDIFQCLLDSTGNFTSCSAMLEISPFFAPYAIDFATVAGVQYAYIGDAGAGPSFPGNVYKCTLYNDGSFNTCTSTPMNNANGWIPYGIDFATIGGIQYAYVADNGTSTTTGHVYQCILNNDGTFQSCTPTTPQNIPTDWVPSDIAFATLNETQYAYVPAQQGSTLGNMYVCDEYFNACSSTPSSPPTPWTPVGIAFR